MDHGTRFDLHRLARIESWMQRYVDERKFAGSSVLVARDGEIVYLTCAGMRSAEDSLPFETDTIVRIFSMSKPVTSVAVMMLAERGLFNLDTPVSEFIPEFSDCRALVDGATAVDQCDPAPCPTIHQLLTHTSGLSYDFNEGVLAAAYAEREIGFAPGSGGLEKNARKAAAMPLAFQPGSRWEYSIGIDVLGRVVEVVSGKSLDVFFEEEIAGPLGMVDTGFSVPDAKLPRLASCYSATESERMQLFDNAASSIFSEGNVTTFSGGGGLLSTLADYFRFAEMLRLGGALDGIRLLSPRTVAFMRLNHLEGDIASCGPPAFAGMPMDGMGFGLGGAVVIDPARARAIGSVGDFGWGGLASTYFWIDPVERLSVVFFTQLMPSNTYRNRIELKALVHGALVD